MASSSTVRNALRPYYQKWESLPFNRQRRRRKIADSYLQPRSKLARKWTKQRTETDNFYYELSSINLSELSSLISIISGIQPQVIDDYINEINNDRDLREHLSQSWANDSEMHDAKIAFGRRIGWYALVRALKPKLVIETGVHHGIGACVLTSALIRNRLEGSPGRYLGTDIDPQAGVLFTGIYAAEGSIAYGDSIATLATIDSPIDFFINDSDHSAEYEAREYETILPRLAPDSIVLGDNSHTNTKLNEFSRKYSRPYLFFKEDPQDHWYPGAGIGISLSAIPVKLL